MDNESTGGFFVKSSWREDSAKDVDETDKSVDRFLQAVMDRYWEIVTSNYIEYMLMAVIMHV